MSYQIPKTINVSCDILLKSNYQCCRINLLLFSFQDIEELINLPPEKILLKWMNYHLQKAGYKKLVSNFSSDLKVAWLLCSVTSSDMHCQLLGVVYTLVLSMNASNVLELSKMRADTWN